MAPQMIHPQDDAGRVFEVLKKGGIAIIPASVGYGVVAIDTGALQRIFVAKKRQPHKRHAMIGSYALHQALHVLPAREAGMVRLLAVDLDLPLGVVAPYRLDHPIMQKLPPEMLARSSVEGTLAMLVNGGAFQDELSRLAMEEELPLMGSSANLTGRGTKTLVDDIEPEIRDVADIIVDYGKAKFNHPRPSSTMLDFKNIQLLRYGACYDVVQDALWRFYGLNLPNDPGRAILFSGHLENEQNRYYAQVSRP